MCAYALKELRNRTAWRFTTKNDNVALSLTTTLLGKNAHIIALTPKNWITNRLGLERSLTPRRACDRGTYRSHLTLIRDQRPSTPRSRHIVPKQPVLKQPPTPIDHVRRMQQDPLPLLHRTKLLSSASTPGAKHYTIKPVLPPAERRS